MSNDHAAGRAPLVDAGSTAMLCCLLCQVKCPRRRGVTNFRAIFGGFNWMRKAVHLTLALTLSQTLSQPKDNSAVTQNFAQCQNENERCHSDRIGRGPTSMPCMMLIMIMMMTTVTMPQTKHETLTHRCTPQAGSTEKA